MYTLADGVSRYLASIENPHTQRTYQTTLDRLQLHFGDDTPLAAVTTARLWLWIQELKDGDYAYSTKRKHIAIVKGFFSHLTALGIVPDQPRRQNPLYAPSGRF